MGDVNSTVSPRGPRPSTTWMKAAYWSVCRRCNGRIETGQWQALVDVPDQGRWWIHEACALELGAPARGTDEPADSTSPEPATTGPVRIVVIGSAAWPRERAVEVRDAIEAVARGHRDVVIVHGAHRDRAGRLHGVEAWAELTAQRLGLTAEPHDTTPATIDELLALRPTVVVAFPLDPCRTEHARVDALAAELAGVPVLVHRPGATAEDVATT